ncbi:NUDIX domain-containing protein [Streptomyces niveus]|uniref:NUDIX domain-containing protein n=1 Tax=Streptomyces niveus TaxID=193462 RepID=UPI003658C3DD
MIHTDSDPAQPGHRRLGALLLILNASGHVLLVKPTYREGWQLPGGSATPNEEPHLAALRECTEETGLQDRVVGDQLITDYVRANPDTGSVEGLNLVFDGGTVPDDTPITLPAAEPGREPELSDCAFVPADRLGDYCQPYQHRRITEALAALADPTRRGYRVEGRTV